MPGFWLLKNDLSFPDPRHTTPEGIVAVGGDLSVPRLLEAYRQGIFPWYKYGTPIYWWCPDPRFVLYPEKLRVSKSMRPYFNQKKFGLSFDRAFREVMLSCATQERKGQYGTWITPEMLEGYLALHREGYAHSVEVWKEDQLVGGLYGIALGRVFFGESMFAKVSNASKFGFIALVRQLQQRGFNLIDCQQETPHLRSLGAEKIARSDFLRHLKENEAAPTLRGSWSEWLQED